MTTSPGKDVETKFLILWAPRFKNSSFPIGYLKLTMKSNATKFMEGPKDPITNIRIQDYVKA